VVPFIWGAGSELYSQAEENYKKDKSNDSFWEKGWRAVSHDIDWLDVGVKGGLEYVNFKGKLGIVYNIGKDVVADIFTSQTGTKTKDLKIDDVEASAISSVAGNAIGAGVKIGVQTFSNEGIQAAKEVAKAKIRMDKTGNAGQALRYNRELDKQWQVGEEFNQAATTIVGTGVNSGLRTLSRNNHNITTPAVSTSVSPRGYDEVRYKLSKSNKE